MMEKEFYTDDFEQLIKEKADQFRMYPSKRVWHSIYNNLHPSRRWPSVIMSLLLLTSLMLIGYLNTSDNSLSRPINSNTYTHSSHEINTAQTGSTKKQISTYSEVQQPITKTGYTNAFEGVITNEPDFDNYTVVRSNRPTYSGTNSAQTDMKVITEKDPAENNCKDLIQSVDSYIKTNKIFADVAVNNKKNKTSTSKTTTKNTGTPDIFDTDIATGELGTSINKTGSLKPEISGNTTSPDLSNLNGTENKPAVTKTGITAAKNALTNEEKAWIENFASENKPGKNKWKSRLAYQFYITPAVNYRKLSTNSKGSVTPFANSDINNSISQKPGFGFEAGVGLTYGFTKKLQLKANLQFNYTNYNIDADQTTHPILTTILLNDPNTGVSYAAARTSTTANAYNSNALKPITLHNRTYQVSLPVGLFYKLSSEKNVDWFAGATVQPTYVFGGNAHIISSDLKSYVSDPSSIRSWNLNLGFETYMNFKLGAYNFQVGPQVRYQVYSTYRKDVALIEKPYAVGLKLGLTKGF
jgi:hypothetical protein